MTKEQTNCVILEAMYFFSSPFNAPLSGPLLIFGPDAMSLFFTMVTTPLHNDDKEKLIWLK